MDIMSRIAAGIKKVSRMTYSLVVYVSETGLPTIPEKITIPIPVLKGGVSVAQKKKEEELLKLQWQGWDILGFCFRNPKGEIIAYQ